MNSEIEKETKSEELNELKILQHILTDLKDLNIEARERILKTILTYFDFTSLKEAEKTIPTARETVGTFSENRNISPKEFLLEKQPETDVERVACLAYYLTHYLDTPHFKTIDVSKLNTDAAQRKFANAAMAVDNAAKQGYLVPAIKGHKQLSAAGERFVQALPDRVVAKEAMAKARPRKKQKSKKEIVREETA